MVVSLFFSLRRFEWPALIEINALQLSRLKSGTRFVVVSSDMFESARRREKRDDDLGTNDDDDDG